MLPLLYRDLVNFIFPPTCIVSNERLTEDNSNKYIKDAILNSLQVLSPLDRDQLSDKVNADDAFAYFTLYPDSHMEKIIHHIKYSGMRRLGTFMGRILAERINIDQHYNYIIPVPLHKIRVRERHYNQSDYISTGIGEALGIEVLSKAVSRIRYTKSQTHLNRQQRIENVKGAFEINSDYFEKIKDKNLIVFDDIVTTGSTINEVIRILKENGAGKILAVCLAMARD